MKGIRESNAYVLKDTVLVSKETALTKCWRGTTRSDRCDVSGSHLSSGWGSDPEGGYSQGKPHSSPEPVQAWAGRLAETSGSHASGV